LLLVVVEELISDNYSCRSATTIPAGRRGPE